MRVLILDEDKTIGELIESSIKESKKLPVKTHLFHCAEEASINVPEINADFLIINFLIKGRYNCKFPLIEKTRQHTPNTKIIIFGSTYQFPCETCEYKDEIHQPCFDLFVKKPEEFSKIADIIYEASLMN